MQSKNPDHRNQADSPDLGATQRGYGNFRRAGWPEGLLRRQQPHFKHGLGNLHGVGGGTFAQVVGHHPHIEGAGLGFVGA